MTEITLRTPARGNPTGMRKLTLLFVAMLTTAAPAWATGGAPPPVPDPATATDDPAPDAASSADEDRALHAEPPSRREIRRTSAPLLERNNLRERQQEKAAARPAAVTVSPQLQAIAQCESGGDPSAVGGGGQFRGKYQFTYATWAAVGGQGDPADAPEVEQDRRAAALYAKAGPGQWPVCGG